MSDLHEPKARILLARLDLQIEEQRLVLEQKDLRSLEVDDEQHNIERDIERMEAMAADALAAASKIKDNASTDARRAKIKAHEYANAVRAKRIRLLELDDEREQIATDKEASAAHIAKLGAEVAQQKARLKESTGG